VKDLRAGQLVSSTSGRDCGKYYLVLRLENDRVLLVNGANRTLDQPKKKNYRHVQAQPGLAGDLAEKFGAGIRVDNSDIKKILSELKGKGGCRACSGEGGKDEDGETGCD